MTSTDSVIHDGLVHKLCTSSVSGFKGYTIYIQSYIHLLIQFTVVSQILSLAVLPASFRHFCLRNSSGSQPMASGCCGEPSSKVASRSEPGFHGLRPPALAPLAPAVLGRLQERCGNCGKRSGNQGSVNRVPRARIFELEAKFKVL